MRNSCRRLISPLLRSLSGRVFRAIWVRSPAKFRPIAVTYTSTHLALPRVGKLTFLADCAVVLRHRVLLKPEAELEGFDADRILGDVLAAVAVPRG